MLYTGISLYFGIYLGKKSIKHCLKGCQNLSKAVIGSETLEERIGRLRDIVILKPFLYRNLQTIFFGRETLNQRFTHFQKGVESWGFGFISLALSYVILVRLFGLIPTSKKEINRLQSECNSLFKLVENESNRLFESYEKRAEGLCLLRKFEEMSLPYIEECFQFFSQTANAESKELLDAVTNYKDKEESISTFCNKFLALILQKEHQFDFSTGFQFYNDKKAFLLKLREGLGVCNQALEETSRYVGSYFGPFIKFSPSAYCSVIGATESLKSTPEFKKIKKKCDDLFWPIKTQVESFKFFKENIIKKIDSTYDCSFFWNSKEMQERIGKQNKEISSQTALPIEELSIFFKVLTSSIQQVKNVYYNEVAISHIVEQELKMPVNIFDQLSKRNLSSQKHVEIENFLEQMFSVLLSKKEFLVQRVPGVNWKNVDNEIFIRSQLFHLLISRFVNNIRTRRMAEQLINLEGKIKDLDTANVNAEEEKLKSKTRSIIWWLFGWRNAYEECKGRFHWKHCEDYYIVLKKLAGSEQAISGLNNLTTHVLV